MATEATGTASEFVIPASQWPRVFLIAVALPLLLTVVNKAILEPFLHRGSTAPAVVVFSVYVIEMTAIAIAAGSGIRQAWLAWTLFAWLLLMINLQLVVAAASQFRWWGVQNGLSVAAFAFAELGFLVVWAIAGHGKWYWRLPVTLAIAVFIFSWWDRLAATLGHSRWHSLLADVHGTPMVVACVVRLIDGLAFRLPAVLPHARLSPRPPRPCRILEDPSYRAFVASRTVSEAGGEI